MVPVAKFIAPAVVEVLESRQAVLGTIPVVWLISAPDLVVHRGEVTGQPSPVTLV